MSPTRRRILLPLLAATAPIVLACGAGPVDKARDALAAGQPDVAFSLLAPPLAEDPSDPELLAALGDVYLMQAGQLSAMPGQLHPGQEPIPRASRRSCRVSPGRLQGEGA